MEKKREKKVTRHTILSCLRTLKAHKRTASALLKLRLKKTQYTMWVSEASLRHQKRRRKFDDSHRFEINSMRF